MDQKVIGGVKSALMRLFGLDLAGSLAGRKKHYKEDRRIFDHTFVDVVALRDSDGSIRVFAQSYCNDIMADVRWNKLKFYAPGRRLSTRAAATAFVNAEILRASQRHPGTKFVCQRYVSMVFDGVLDDDVLTEMSYCLNGQWGVHKEEEEPRTRRCQGCGKPTDELICPKCGEPVLEPVGW